MVTFYKQELCTPTMEANRLAGPMERTHLCLGNHMGGVLSPRCLLIPAHSQWTQDNPEIVVSRREINSQASLGVNGCPALRTQQGRSRRWWPSETREDSAKKCWKFCVS